MTQPHFWNGKLVLVTGVTGFLGGWLCKRLLEGGANVVAVVRTVRPESQFYLLGLERKATVEHGSVYDAKFMTNLLEKHRFDACFHTAYGADVNRVLKEPLECFRSAVESTWLLLDLLRQRNSTALCVVSSSDKAYGTQAVPYLESSPLTPLHPYEVAKASQDLAAQSYGKIFGLPVVVTRCGNYFGPYDFNLTRLIPGLVREIVAGEPPTLRSDGNFTRDFLYIEDAVDVQLLVAEKLAEDKTLRGEAFNFSYGEQLEVIGIVRRVLDILGSSLQPVVNDTVWAEIRHLHLSSEKARERLDWHPNHGFDEGLERTVKWYRDFFSEKQAKQS